MASAGTLGPDLDGLRTPPMGADGAVSGLGAGFGEGGEIMPAEGLGGEGGAADVGCAFGDWLAAEVVVEAGGGVVAEAPEEEMLVALGGEGLGEVKKSRRPRPWRWAEGRR